MSSLTLALEGSGLDPNSDLARVLRVLDVVFTAVFTTEMALKVMAFGVVFPPQAC